MAMRKRGETLKLVLEAIARFKAENDGNSPTLANLSELTETSGMNVYKHLRKLEENGYIYRTRSGRWGLTGGEYVAPNFEGIEGESLLKPKFGVSNP